MFDFPSDTVPTSVIANNPVGSATEATGTTGPLGIRATKLPGGIETTTGEPTWATLSLPAPILISAL